MRKRLLFICQTFPYPPDGGVWIRSLNTLKILAQEFDVRAVCFERMGRASGRDPKSVATGLAALNNIAPTSLLPVPQAHNRARFAWDHARSVVTNKPYTSFLYWSREAERTIRTLAEEHFDLVHLDSLVDLASFVPLLPRAPIVGVHHNVESALLRRRGRQLGGLSGAYLSHQGALIERVENAYCPRAALNITVSDIDREMLEQIAPSARFLTIPNGVDTEEFSPSAGPTSGVVYVGGLSWHPNREALDFWCDRVKPHLDRLGVGEVPATWVGQASRDEMEQYARRARVRLTGYVDDVRPEMSRSSVFVVPLQSGGGTRLKILNAWSMGMAVVSTSVGCEGLAARHGENILIADTPSDFAAAVASLLKDEAARTRIGQLARQTALEVYDWRVLGTKMHEQYRSIIDAGDNKV
jgi:glycosyltransferase involved in cell wall biosynthesis